MHIRTDAELLNEYVSKGDDAAFGELVTRHGAFVHRACLRLLKDEHEAQDACQTVFVVLAQKARRLRGGDLSAWLYRVGHLVAAETARKRMRRAQREKRYAADETGGGEAPVSSETDRQAVLDAVDTELMALSGANREAVLLRHLRGHSQEEAARLAGCSVGTLSSRASRGIEEIRRRLARRGIALGVPVLAAALEAEAQAAIPEALLSSTMTAVKAYAAGGAATAAVSVNVAALTKGVLNMMFWSGVKTAAVVVAASLVVAGSGAIVAQEVAQRKAVNKVESLQPLSAADVVVRIPPLAKAPTIDGRLDAGEWVAASTATAPGSATGASVRVVQPRIHLGYDNENLYVACEIPIRPTGYQLRHESKQPDTLSHPLYGLAGDDCVKLELWPCADPAADMKYGTLNLQWNAIGTLADWYINHDDGADFRWSCGGAFRTVALPDTNWVSEWTIPLTALRFGRYAVTNANGATAAKLPPVEASIWRLRFSCRVGEVSNTLVVAAFFQDYEIPAWNANQPLPAAEAALLAKAEERYAAKAYAEALTQYDAFRTQFPKSAAMSFALARKGRCLQLMNTPFEAIKTYGEVLEFFPNQVAHAAPALLYTAQCHYLSGNTKEAMKALAELSADKDYAKHPAAACGNLLLEGIQAARERP